MHISMLTNRLKELPNDRAWALQSLELHDPMTVLLVSVFVGGLGVDRFLIGQYGLGVLKLVTCGGLFIWHMADLFIIQAETRRMNFQKVMQATGYPI